MASRFPRFNESFAEVVSRDPRPPNYWMFDGGFQPASGNAILGPHGYPVEGNAFVPTNPQDVEKRVSYFNVILYVNECMRVIHTRLLTCAEAFQL